MKKAPLVVAGILVSITGGLAACFFWFVINTGVTLNASSVVPFLFVTGVIFVVAFVGLMGVWLWGFKIWPFNRK